MVDGLPGRNKERRWSNFDLRSRSLSSPEGPTAFDLDFAVRLFRGDFRSSQTLSKETLALSLIKLAAEADLPSPSQTLILSVARALTNPDAKWQLRLGRGKPGQLVGFDEMREEFVRDAEVFSHVEKLKAQGWKMDAAVADAGQFFGRTRSAIFACRKRYRAHSIGMRAMIEEWSGLESD